MEIDIRKKIQTEATKEVIKNQFNGIIDISPRVGKTKLVIDALNKVNQPLSILVMAPKLAILDSWKDELKKWKLKDEHTVNFVWSNSLKKEVKNTYNLIIADECHAYNINVLLELRSHQQKKTSILGLTGTLDEVSSFSLQNWLSLNVIYRYSVEQAIKDKIVADYEIVCVKCQLDDEEKHIEAGMKDNLFMQTEAEAYKYWNNQYERLKARGQLSKLKYPMMKRTNIIYNSLAKFKKSQEVVAENERCLIFTARQDVANRLGEDTYHSKSRKGTLDEFQKGTINKLSSVGMISLGITIPNLKVVVFNQLKSVESLAIQQAMRAMNLEGGVKAKIYILYLEGTQDEVWLKSAIKGFEKNKIKFI